MSDNPQPSAPVGASRRLATPRPHRRSIRLKRYDYSQPNGYFLTICAHNREFLFGEIRHGVMAMNESGCIIVDEWERTANVRPNVELDAFIVMPNHFHGIIIINNVGA